MKMYKFVYNPWSKKIETTEFLVEEKFKTYKVLDETKGIWQSRIRKDEIGVLRGANNCMFSTTPDTSEYLAKMIQLEGKSIRKLEERLDFHKKTIERLREIAYQSGVLMDNGGK